MSREELMIRVATADTKTLAKLSAALDERPQAGADSVALCTMTETARRLNVSRNTVYRLLQSGTLKTIQLRPGCRRIPATELQRLASGYQTRIEVPNV